MPFDGGWTVLDRMRHGKEVVVHGDGTSLWTLTHHTDFARGFVPLLARPQAAGEIFHLTSDGVLTWNQIAESLAAAAGVEARIVHVPSTAIAAAAPEWGAGLIGDKADDDAVAATHDDAAATTDEDITGECVDVFGYPGEAADAEALAASAEVLRGMSAREGGSCPRNHLRRAGRPADLSGPPV